MKRKSPARKTQTTPSKASKIDMGDPTPRRRAQGRTVKAYAAKKAVRQAESVRNIQKARETGRIGKTSPALRKKPPV